MEMVNRIADLVKSVSKASRSLPIRLSAKGLLSRLRLDDEGKSLWLGGLAYATVYMSSHEIIDAACDVFETW